MPENPFLSLILSEADSGKATPRSLAVLYAVVLACGGSIPTEDWRRVNQAVEAALGLDTPRRVDAFRTLAWAINDAAADRQVASAAFALRHAHDAPRAVQ